MIKKALFFMVLFTGSALTAGPLDYTNNIKRYWDDSSKSAFRIKKSNNAVQHLNYIQVPLLTGISNEGSGALLGFGNSGSPTLVLDTASDGEFSLSIADDVIGSVSFQLVLPPDYDNEGDLEVRASSETNVTTTTKLAVSISLNDGTPVSLTNAEIGAEANTSISTAVSGLSGAVAGDKVTIQIGRDDTNSGTGTLVIHTIGFKYNESTVFSE